MSLEVDFDKKNDGSFEGFNIEYNCPKYRNIFWTCLSNVNCFTTTNVYYYVLEVFSALYTPCPE